MSTDKTKAAGVRSRAASNYTDKRDHTRFAEAIKSLIVALGTRGIITAVWAHRAINALGLREA